MNQENLRKAISIASSKNPISSLPKALRLVIWELMKTQTKVKKLMHKQINKVKKSVQAGSKKKALHEIGSLLTMGKKMDAKVAKRNNMAPKKKR